MHGDGEHISLASVREGAQVLLRGAARYIGEVNDQMEPQRSLSAQRKKIVISAVSLRSRRSPRFLQDVVEEAHHSCPRHRRRHWRFSRAAPGRRRRAPRLRVRGPRAVRVAADDLGRAGSRGLVARLSGGGPRGARRRAASPPRRSPASVCPARCTERCCSARTSAVLRPSIIWCDQRTEAECRWLDDTIGPQRLLELTVESGAHEFHAHQAPLGPHARARRCGAGCVTCCCRRTTSVSG